MGSTICRITMDRFPNGEPVYFVKFYNDEKEVKAIDTWECFDIKIDVDALKEITKGEKQ